MSQTHHHRSRAWAPFSSRPSHVLTVDDHTHLHSTIAFSKEMAEQASELHQPVQQTYSAEQLLDFAQYAGVGQIIDVGCELPDWPIALDLARRFPDRVHTALAIHPVEAVRHGHRAVAGPDGLEVHYDPWHDVSYADALLNFPRLPSKVKTKALSLPLERRAWISSAWGKLLTACKSQHFATILPWPKNSTFPCKFMTAMQTKHAWIRF